MKSKHFFEINEPYFALIKAENKAEAEKIYNETVADTDEYENFQEEEINEVSRDYALIECTKAGDGKGNLKSTKFIIETFNKPESEILIMDGSLL
ncbi:hypothetical protein [Bacillus atrophaeus]|uniref:hypothetical protein n=1 Tax=Bacillus atrophaeus TaxID=1452 RepID=UPI0007791F30|nr:hypothetical protein [Bacillus atrophaeus]KYD05340.1 hypothetical protein B4144_1948 [Bacillus atrophaeus]